MNRIKLKNVRQARRDRRVRKNITGSPERYRLTVFRSLGHIYAQIIDDSKGTTLSAVSDMGLKGKTKTDRAKLAGAELAKKAKAAGITQVSFDRGGFIFTGRVRALAEGAREGGLVF